MSRQADLQAAITKNETYLANKGALHIYNKIEAFKAELLTLDLSEDTTNGSTPEPTPEPVPDTEPPAAIVGPDPVPNNALAPDSTYGTDNTLESFTEKYGRSPEQVYSEVVTGLLRPDPDLWAAFPSDEAANYLRDDATRQQAVLDYFAGKAPFSSIASYFGSWFGDLGLVDIAAIHDLGAG